MARKFAVPATAERSEAPAPQGLTTTERAPKARKPVAEVIQVPATGEEQTPELILEKGESSLVVPAIEGARPMYTFDENGKKTALGLVRYRDYEADRKLRVAYFGEDTAHPLGKASGNFRIVDHWTAAQPLLKAGFKVDMLRHFRDGAELFAVLTHPDLTMRDVIDWDADMYNGQPTTMRMAIRLRNNLNIGNSIRYDIGFFRVICTNGLIASALDMGNAAFTHRIFETPKLKQWVDDTINNWTGGRQLRDVEAKALDWPIQTFTEILEDPGYVNRLPAFARIPAQHLLNKMPQWSRVQLVEQMQSMRQNSEVITALDLLNAVTNLNNLSPAQSWLVYRRLDPIYNNFVTLCDIGAFVSDQQGFGLDVEAAQARESQVSPN
jgi:hypothetical protein